MDVLYFVRQDSFCCSYIVFVCLFVCFMHSVHQHRCHRQCSRPRPASSAMEEELRKSEEEGERSDDDAACMRNDDEGDDDSGDEIGDDPGECIDVIDPEGDDDRAGMARMGRPLPSDSEPGMVDDVDPPPPPAGGAGNDDVRDRLSRRCFIFSRALRSSFFHFSSYLSMTSRCRRFSSSSAATFLSLPLACLRSCLSCLASARLRSSSSLSRFICMFWIQNIDADSGDAADVIIAVDWADDADDDSDGDSAESSPRDDDGFLAEAAGGGEAEADAKCDDDEESERPEWRAPDGW